MYEYASVKKNMYLQYYEQCLFAEFPHILDVVSESVNEVWLNKVTYPTYTVCAWLQDQHAHTLSTKCPWVSGLNLQFVDQNEHQSM